MDKKIACGCVFISYSTKRILLNWRAQHKTHGLNWGLWGGMLESGETPKDCLLREIKEEMGLVPDISKIYPFDVYHSSDDVFTFYTFVCVTPSEFNPVLNSESNGYGWFDMGVWPGPLHSGVKKSFANKKALEKLHLIVQQHS